MVGTGKTWQNCLCFETKVFPQKSCLSTDQSIVDISFYTKILIFFLKKKKKRCHHRGCPTLLQVRKASLPRRGLWASSGCLVCCLLPFFHQGCWQSSSQNNSISKISKAIVARLQLKLSRVFPVQLQNNSSASMSVTHNSGSVFASEHEQKSPHLMLVIAVMVKTHLGKRFQY